MIARPSFWVTLHELGEHFKVTANLYGELYVD